MAPEHEPQPEPQDVLPPPVSEWLLASTLALVDAQQRLMDERRAGRPFPTYEIDEV